jgi:hypothetical protein
MVTLPGLPGGVSAKTAPTAPGGQVALPILASGTPGNLSNAGTPCGGRWGARY